MSYLPVLKGKGLHKFTNPLSGFVYDNKKYAQSCIIDAMPARNNPKCRSVPHSFFKEHPRPPQAASSQDIVQREFRLTSKVFNLTKRLSDPNKLRCTRNKWLDGDTEDSQIIKRTAPIEQMMQTRRREAEGEVFRFPEIRALVLTVFHSTADHDKVLKLSLKSYFELFFKDTLAGFLFPELVTTVQPYLRAIVQQDQQPNQQGLNSDTSRVLQLEGDLGNILTKQELYNKLREFDQQGKKEQAMPLVRTYCLPSKEVRDVFMQDLLKLVSVQLYQNFNCNRHNQYTLLSEDGSPITDFAAISFSTGFLFVAQRDSAQEEYQRYVEITSNHSRLKNRFQFREQLKYNFRQKIAKSNFFDAAAEERQNRETVQERRGNLERAQMIVDTKNEKNSVSRMRLRDARINSEAIIDGRSKSKSKSRQKSKEKLVLERQKKPMVSPFSIDQKIEQEFKLLKLKNDFTNTILKNDETARDKIEIAVLIKESIYFQQKSLPQIERILCGLDMIDREEQYQRYQQRLITIQDYARMRKIINCVGEREHTIRFVDRYLNYDQFGQLRREDFREILAFIVGGETKTADVILNTIWGWLDHNGVTSPSGVRRLDMQLLYQRNKLVYYFLISLIFGTNEVSVLELTQDMLAD